MKKNRNFQPKHRKAPGRTFVGRQSWADMYDTVWEGYTRKYLAINKRCYCCGADANTVDHLVPHQGDAALFKKTDNHIPLCTRCHNKITALFDRRHRTGNPVDNKIKYMNYERACRDLTFRVKVLPTYP